VSVLMPVCNEADIIAEVVTEWHEQVFAYLPPGSELVFDDCSTDGTHEILQGLARSAYGYIRVDWSAKDGFFNSAMRLYKRARCPLVFFTDSDGQYPPADFWKVAADIDSFEVHGVKVGRHDLPHRLVASAGFNWLCRWLFRTAGSDINSAFRLIHRPILDAILDDINVMPTLLNAELYLRAEHAGFRIKDVPIGHRPRQFGVSRGLPLRRFVHECYGAYRGLFQLRREFNHASVPPRPSAGKHAV
jgi:glycosyltransferase involved in cell wall biosynthesis